MATSPGSDRRPLPLAKHEETSQSPSGASLRGGPIHNLIVLRAHRKWIERGCKEDTAIQDWLEAEAEVQAEIRRGRRY
jgi:hypothetical protein